MPTLKHDTRTERRLRHAIGIALVSMGAGMILLLAWGWTWSVFLCAFAGGMVGVIGFFVLMYRYRCPQCSAALPYRGGPFPSSQAMYHCHHCEVLWDTGLWDANEPDSVKPAHDPSPEVLERIHELLFAGSRVEAVKLWRTSCGGGLSEAVFRINEIEDGLRAASPDRLPLRSRSPAGIVFSGLMLIMLAVALAAVGGLIALILGIVSHLTK